jgi:hypothetical protein
MPRVPKDVGTETVCRLYLFLMHEKLVRQAEFGIIRGTYNVKVPVRNPEDPHSDLDVKI